VSKARTSERGKHALPRDKNGRESEWSKDWQQRESMHFLETRRAGKVSEARTSDRGKAPTL
jgi:hypothetical protein